MLNTLPTFPLHPITPNHFSRNLLYLSITLCRGIPIRRCRPHALDSVVLVLRARRCPGLGAGDGANDALKRFDVSTRGLEKRECFSFL